MNIPTGNKIEFKEKYSLRWRLMENDAAKVKYLLMLKERAFMQKDKEAAEALKELTALWLGEPYVA